MRLSNTELKEKYCTFWNDEKHDIGAIYYGDTPLVHYDESEYEKYQNYWAKDESFTNIMATDAYIYSQMVLMINIEHLLVKYILQKMVMCCVTMLM